MSGLKASIYQKTLIHTENWLDSLDTHPVGATLNPPDLAARFQPQRPKNGTEADIVIDELVALSQNGLNRSASGRFFAWVIGGALPSALCADWLISTWDQNAAISACGPAVSMIEDIAGKWLLDLFDLPRASSYGFTTGCQLAHFTALAAARHRVLANVGWNVSEDGLCGAPQIRVLVNAQKHASVERAVRYLGLGSRALIPVQTDQQGHINADNLKHVLSQSDAPAIVVLNAADLNIGAFDDFKTLIPIAKAANAWVHIDGAFGLFVDGAFGLFARASAKKTISRTGY